MLEYELVIIWKESLQSLHQANVHDIQVTAAIIVAPLIAVIKHKGSTPPADTHSQKAEKLDALRAGRVVFPSNWRLCRGLWPPNAMKNLFSSENTTFLKSLPQSSQCHLANFCRLLFCLAFTSGLIQRLQLRKSVLRIHR